MESDNEAAITDYCLLIGALFQVKPATVGCFNSGTVSGTQLDPCRSLYVSKHQCLAFWMFCLFVFCVGMQQKIRFVDICSGFSAISGVDVSTIFIKSIYKAEDLFLMHMREDDMLFTPRN